MRRRRRPEMEVRRRLWIWNNVVSLYAGLDLFYQCQLGF
jgi:hypothetical protein